MELIILLISFRSSEPIAAIWLDIPCLPIVSKYNYVLQWQQYAACVCIHYICRVIRLVISISDKLPKIWKTVIDRSRCVGQEGKSIIE